MDLFCFKVNQKQTKHCFFYKYDIYLNKKGGSMKVLVIDACVREELSSTAKLYKRYLNSFCQDQDVTILQIFKTDIAPLNQKTLTKRQELIEAKNFSHPMFRYAHQFKDADLILIAAPTWDFSFPSVLKVYIEHLCISGLTFTYTKQGIKGLCKAEKLIYFSTSGGYINGQHLGFEYVKQIGSFLGIKKFQHFYAQGLDINPSKRQEILDNATTDMLNFSHQTGNTPCT